MIKNLVICDRCGKECSGTTYYTIEIYGKDIIPSNDGRQSFTTVLENLASNSMKIFGGGKHYCEECKNALKQFLKGEQEYDNS
jgi:hypothetical protein